MTGIRTATVPVSLIPKPNDSLRQRTIVLVSYGHPGLQKAAKGTVKSPNHSWSAESGGSAVGGNNFNTTIWEPLPRQSRFGMRRSEKR
jgi:hypothetical protein